MTNEHKINLRKKFYEEHGILPRNDFGDIDWIETLGAPVTIALFLVFILLFFVIL